MSDPSDGWDLYVNPKSKKKEDPKAAVTDPKAGKPQDGTELYVTPKKPKEAAPTLKESGGAIEMPGSPREAPKPAVGSGAAEEDFRRQRPGAAEEDAEVWDGTKWTTPSGRTENLAPGAAEIPDIVRKQAEAGPTVESDADTDIIVAPKRVLPPEDKASPMPRFGNPVQAAKQGKEGRDFQEYQKPLIPPTQQSPAASPPTPFPSTGSAAQPFKPYGASTVPAAPAAPSGPPPAVAPPDQVHANKVPHGALNVLLVGSGAREHAMALAIRRSQRAHLFVVMKHRNPGLAKSATGFKLLDDRDAAGIVAWAKAQKIHLAVVGPETTLEAGVTDALRAAGIAVASPSQAAARVETSKTFMRELMAKHRIPGQLAHHAFTDAAQALAFLDRHGPVWAVKPVGLTGGKGVQVYGDHFADVAGAKAYVATLFGPQGGAVQFEELARGEEFTVMAFTDGTTILPMPAVQDHKRLLEGDKGPNTGGMGSYAQPDGLLPFLSAEEYSQAAQVLQGIVDALRAEGTPYVGTIYGQFMLTAAGPKVIEVNARFGDPEAMNVLHTLESDYVGLLEAMATGTLAGKEARFRGMATIVKYVVPRGYGQGTPATGKPIEIDDFNVKRTGGMVYMGAIEQMPYGGLETMASRTVAVLGEGPNMETANAVCEASLKHVHGKDLYVRHDIGSGELLAQRVRHMAELRGTPAATPAVF